MTGTTSVPGVQFTPTGVVIPPESDVLAGVIQDINSAFGGGLNFTNQDGTQNLSTPQGQLASSESAIIAESQDVVAQVIAGIDPATSSGAMQDAIGRIYFMTRNPALPTTVTVTCVGEADTVIPAGYLIQDSAGNTYASEGAATIPSGGSIDVQFANILNGPIPCGANSVSIYQALAGLDAVSNTNPGILGVNVESPQDFEFRRQQSVAINAQGTVDAVKGAVFNVSGVTDCFVVDNPKGTTVDYGPTNYALAPHSICVAVAGGADADVAQAIWTKKNDGSDMNGATTVTVYDTSYDVPQPAYDITFLRSTATPIKYAIQIQANPNLPSNIVNLVKNAVIASFTGADGGTRARIAGQILSSRYYGGISAISPAVAIVSILVGISSPTLNVQPLGIDQAPTIDASNISVALV